MKSRSAALCILICATSLCAVPVFGTVTLISTLGQPNNGVWGVSGLSQRHASDFQTGADVTSVRELTLRLQNTSGTAKTVFAEIWSNNAGNPGTIMGSFDTSFSIPGLSPSPIAYTATDAGILLASNTIYWLVLRPGDSLSGAGVQLAAGQTVDSGGLYSSITGTAYKLTNNSGATWTNFPAVPNSAPMYQLVGYAPEPSRALLMALGLGVMNVRRRRSS
jgi:hypothetical protein